MPILTPNAFLTLPKPLKLLVPIHAPRQPALERWPSFKGVPMVTHQKARRILAKAKRAAKAIVRGDEILEFVEERKDQLVEAAMEDADTPPVAILGDPLHEEFGDDVLHLPVRQWIGSLVRALLAVEGFEVQDTGIRIVGNVMFKSGTTYERIHNPADEDDEDKILETAFAHLVSGLNFREQRSLRKVLDVEMS